jgi:hypothetical protein
MSACLFRQLYASGMKIQHNGTGALEYTAYSKEKWDLLSTQYGWV